MSVREDEPDLMSLYFVAFYKHSAAHYLIEGPFIHWEDAQDRIEAEKSSNRCIVKTTLMFELVKEPE